MAFFKDFVSGATELPRQVLGAGAVAFGADKQKTQQELGLAPQPEKSLWHKVTQHPGKILGQLALYSLLPETLFLKGAKGIKRAAGVAATMGTYGAVANEAQAKLSGQQAHPMDAFVLDGLMTAATFGAFHAASKATAHIKNKAVRARYLKSMLLDMNVPVDTANHFAKASEADRHAMLQHLQQKGFENVGMIEQIFQNKQVGKNLETGKTGLLWQNERPATPVSADSKIAEEAKGPIANLRAAMQDHDAVNTIAANKANTVAQAIKEMPEASMEKIMRKLDGEEVNLSRAEEPFYHEMRALYDTLGSMAATHGLIKTLRTNYLPHILIDTEKGAPITEQDIPVYQQKIENYLAEHEGKGRHTSLKTGHSKMRLIDVPLSKVEEATGGRFVPATTNLGELTKMYITDLARAASMKNVAKHLDHSMLSVTPKEGWLPVNYPVLKGEHLKRLSKAQRGAIQGIAFDDVPLYAHPDYAPSLDMIFKPSGANTVVRGLMHANNVSKRMLILGSLFHLNALVESALFSGVGGFGAAASGAGAGFLITGGNPLGMLVGASMGAGARVLVRSRNIVDALAHGDKAQRDAVEYALRYVDVRPPRDIGNDSIYRAVGALQKTIDKYMPESIAKGGMKKGAQTFGYINKAIDVLMWHRMMAGAKILLFNRELEKLVERNAFLPAEQRLSQHQLATAAGQFANDAFGGQNWRQLAEGVDNQFGRRYAAAMATADGTKFANLALFAPDWTVSNIRIIAKAFPGIESNPEVRRMYQKYALRAAFYWAVMGSVVQMALTGKPIWQNSDPTQLDLGDGRHVTLSKQLREPFEWVRHPIHEASVKQSSILKMGEEQIANKQYIGGNARQITYSNQPLFTKSEERLKIVGKHYAPIFAQNVNEQGLDGVYGFFGHPINGHIRHGFKNGKGVIDGTSGIQSSSARHSRQA